VLNVSPDLVDFIREPGSDDSDDDVPARLPPAGSLDRLSTDLDDAEACERDAASIRARHLALNYAKQSSSSTIKDTRDYWMLYVQVRGIKYFRGI
jgi:hypothetical protein